MPVHTAAHRTRDPAHLHTVQQLIHVRLAHPALGLDHVQGVEMGQKLQIVRPIATGVSGSGAVVRIDGMDRKAARLPAVSRWIPGWHCRSG